MDEENLQPEYSKELLQKGIKDIFAAQRLIANKRIYQREHAPVRERREGITMRNRAGYLMNSLQSPEYILSSGGSGLHADMEWPLYIRFLDMKRLGNWKIYNRQVWGILYKETFIKMRFSYSEWLDEFTKRTLKQSFQPLN